MFGLAWPLPPLGNKKPTGFSAGGFGNLVITFTFEHPNRRTAAGSVRRLASQTSGECQRNAVTSNAA
jgi:hypothetical protein